MSKFSVIDNSPASEWTDTVVNTDEIKAKRTRANPPINYEGFEKMTVFVDDSFWKDRLMEAKIGSFPPKISFTSGTLMFNTGIELCTIDLDISISADLSKSAEIFIGFYKRYLLMFSPTDKDIQDKELMDDVELDLPVSWGQLEQRQMKITICNFVDDERTLHHLNAEEVLSLRRLLRIAFILKYINNETVVIDRQIIATQTFMFFDKETRKYTLNEESYRPPKTKTNRKKKSKELSTYGLRWIGRCNRLSAASNRAVRNYSFPPQEETDDGSSSDL